MANREQQVVTIFKWYANGLTVIILTIKGLQIQSKYLLIKPFLRYQGNKFKEKCKIK